MNRLGVPGNQYGLRGRACLEAMFSGLARARRKGLITYVTAGDPDVETTCRLVTAMVRAGADLVEIGLPFSDPLADGPVIQAASKRALDGGFKTRHLFEILKEVRKDIQVPLAVLSYYNPVFRHGLEAFAEEMTAAGADALLVPDLAWEERGPLLAALQPREIPLIPFLAPTSTPDRLASVGREAEGFIYCVSVTGVTGARTDLPPGLEGFLRRVRSFTEKPLALGFGISSPEQAATASHLVDAIIVGSAVVDIVARNGRGAPGPVGDFVTSLRASLDGVQQATIHREIVDSSGR